MGLGRILFLVFLAVPLIEIAFFVVIGNAVGLWPTLAGVLITAIAGSLVLRYQGMAVFNDIVDLQTPGYLPYGGNLCVVLESDWGNLKVLGTAPLGS